MKLLFLLLLTSVCFGTYISNKDIMLEIPRGNIAGQSSVNKFGQNHDVESDEQEDIWDGSYNYVFPTSTNITHIAQTADQVAMRGQTIEVQGLDLDWELVVQNATLDGANTTTKVLLATKLRRVFRMRVLADVVTDQPICVGNSLGTTTNAMIQAGNNQTLMAIYTIPAGKTGYITRGYASVSEATGKEPKSTEIRMWMADRGNGYEFQLKKALGIPKAGSMLVMEFKPYGKVPEKTDIKVSAYCEGEAGNVSAGFDIILCDQ